MIRIEQNLIDKNSNFNIYRWCLRVKNRDWLFVDENRIHNFRSAGVLINDGKILVQRGINDSEYTLPGGHVAWVEEVFWKWGEKEAHTLCHYHLVNLNSPSQIPLNGVFKSLETDESRLIFQWVGFNELQDYKIYPVFLKDKINNLLDGIEHFVTRD